MLHPTVLRFFFVLFCLLSDTVSCFSRQIRIYRWRSIQTYQELLVHRGGKVACRRLETGDWRLWLTTPVTDWDRLYLFTLSFFLDVNSITSTLVAVMVVMVVVVTMIMMILMKMMIMMMMMIIIIIAAVLQRMLSDMRVEDRYNYCKYILILDTICHPVQN